MIGHVIREHINSFIYVLSNDGKIVQFVRAQKSLHMFGVSAFGVPVVMYTLIVGSQYFIWYIVIVNVKTVPRFRLSLAPLL
jgi:hypothetical protein